MAAEDYGNIDLTPQAEDAKNEKSEEAKRLYRKIASTIHPDKAIDNNSLKIRTNLMAELNDAYNRRDIEKLQEILNKWQESPEAITGDDTGAELVRTIRTIAKIKRRIGDIEKEISDLMISDLYLLMNKVHAADRVGRNLLAESAARIEDEIQEAQKELSTII